MTTKKTVLPFYCLSASALRDVHLLPISKGVRFSGMRRSQNPPSRCGKQAQARRSSYRRRRPATMDALSSHQRSAWRRRSVSGRQRW